MHKIQAFLIELFCLSFFCVTVGFSQGAYFEKGQSGLGVTAGYASSKDISGISASAGYSFAGIFDLGFSLTRFSPDEKISGYDVTIFSWSPGATLHIIKQDTMGTPVSLAFSGEYESNSYSSAGLDQYRWTLTGHYFTVGASLYRNFYLSSTAYIQPTVHVAYVMGSVELKTSYGDTGTADDNATLYGFSAGFVFKTSPTTSLGITPGVGRNGDATTYSINAIFICSIIP